MVFDDITEVVSAQRSAAWSEVARRLAHEIKNPLTPIQLSAERLQLKLESKLAATDQAMLLRSVATIVNQVHAMKRLVNEFRDYARLPAAQMKPLDLNGLVNEVLALYGEAHGQRPARRPAGRRLAAHHGRRHAAAPGDPQPRAERARRRRRPGRRPRRGAHRDARDEHGELRAVRLTVIDNGPGFAENVLKRAFEPYVTTKAKGTGLAWRW